MTTHVYLLILNDNPVEVLSAWSTHDLALEEFTRLLDSENGNDRYWLENRLELRGIKLNTPEDM